MRCSSAPYVQNSVFFGTDMQCPCYVLAMKCARCKERGPIVHAASCSLCGFDLGRAVAGSWLGELDVKAGYEDECLVLHLYMAR